MAKVRLNFNLSTQLVLNLGLLELILEENFQCDYILALQSHTSLIHQFSTTPSILTRMILKYG